MFKKLLRFSGHTDNIPRKNRQNTGNKHPAWLDDILVVTKGTKEKHKREVIDVLTKLENAGYRLSENETDFDTKLTKTVVDNCKTNLKQDKK